MAINKVILLGNVGKDPDIRDGAGGTKFATFSLATTDRAYTKRDGTQVPERTEWHSIVVNGPQVSVVERFVHKGTMIYLEGKLRTRKYTARDNTERYVTEIMCDELQLCGQPQQAATPAPAPAPAPAPPFYNQQRYQNAPAPVQQNWAGDDNLPT